MAQKAEETIEFPLDVIKASPGFAFDVGSSVVKLLYRSKEDFENGEPKNKDMAASGNGPIRKKLIRRENLEDVLEFIKENCDMTRDKNGECTIYSTGAGGNRFKTKIEEELNVKLDNLSEFDMFVQTLQLNLQTKSCDEVFKPMDEEGIKEADRHLKMMASFKEGSEKGGMGTFEFKDKAEEYDREKDDRFPCLLAMLGSGFALFQVDEKGNYSIIGGLSMGGRFFLGLTSYLTGVTDFDEISKLIEESDGATADTMWEELIDPNVEDMYSNIKVEGRAFPLAKGLTESKDKTTKGDLIHSVLETQCETIAQVVYLTARTHNIPRVYFSGNFVNTPKAETIITRMMILGQLMPGPQVNFEFIKEGGILGVIGAFRKPYELLQEKVAGEP